MTLTDDVTLSNERTAPEYRIVCRGLTIRVNDQELTILDLAKRSERVVGDCYASWLVLVERDRSHRDPWVVWILVARPDGWMLESGTYCMTEEQGREAFARRS